MKFGKKKAGGQEKQTQEQIDQSLPLTQNGHKQNTNGDATISNGEPTHTNGDIDIIDGEDCEDGVKIIKKTKSGLVHADDHVAPDGGYGWLVMFTSFWVNGTIFGILNTFGVLYVRMLKDFSNGSEDMAFKTSWVGSLYIGMTFGMSPVASILTDRLGIRKTAILGGIIATSGMLASSFIRQLEWLYLTYGILLGFGSSLVYTPSMVILGHYFRKRLGIVNGIVCFGSSVFTIALPFIENYLLDTIGLANTMRVLAGLMATLILCGISFIPMYTNRHEELDHYLSTASLADTVQGCCTWVKKFLNVSIWKNFGYVMWVVSVPVALFGYFIPFVHLVKHTGDIFPDFDGGILVMCLGATSGVGRLLFGKLADLPKCNRVRMQQIGLAIMGVSTTCIPFAGHWGGLIAIVLVLGIFDGCFVCLLGPIAFDILGPKGASQGLGFLLGLFSIPMTVGPPVAGLLYDHMHTYRIAFHIAGAPPLIGALLMFLIPRVRQHFPAVSEVEDIAAMNMENLDEKKVGEKTSEYFIELNRKWRESNRNLDENSLSGSCALLPIANQNGKISKSVDFKDLHILRLKNEGPHLTRSLNFKDVDMDAKSKKGKVLKEV
ncbi:unnamed protein product [Owenia fusiformis]|uniref:Uncharacterized protein n=1 Tax=Owenia fusiformis TaxID=6347 RepID=A0A8J1XJD2_OWEFU|nr:unnamed protein product [Owenia fusiformis]